MTEWQWWCAARADVWTWTWQPYPGVWIIVGLALLGLTMLNRPGEPSTNAVMLPPPSVWSRVSMTLGLLLLWAALDWPVGALGAGYLASVHAVQFVVLAMMVPALLLGGIGPAGRYRLTQYRLAQHRLLAIGARVWQRMTSPAVAMALFAGVMIVSHLPPVTDALMASATGSFVLDMSWLVSGLAFAWPLIMPRSEVPSETYLSPLMRIGYLFAGTIAHVFIGMWLLVADYPLYATYELAPPLGVLSPRMDQQVAGGVMLLLGTPLVVIAIGLQFRELGSEANPETL